MVPYQNMRRLIGFLSGLFQNKYENAYGRVVWNVRRPKYDERLDEITSPERGTQSERDLISALLDYGISLKAIFHDLILKNGKEKST